MLILFIIPLLIQERIQLILLRKVLYYKYLNRHELQ